jgi:hypothetical protein
VSIPADRLSPLQPLCESAQALQEGGHTYIYLKNLRIRIAGINHVVDALLCPMANTGYVTRLFLSVAFPQKGVNWSVHQILGRAWHTWSWNGVPADLPLLQMLMCHLDALK